MKKIILILLFITSLLGAQEIIQIGDFDLTIPADYYELKNAYIIMANLYIESEDNLDTSLENFDNLKIEYDNVVVLYKESEEDVKDLSDLIDDVLIPNTKELEGEIDTLSKELEKWIKPDLFQLYGGVSFSNEIVPDVHVGAFLNLNIYEQYSIRVDYLLLDQYSISIGYKF